MTTNHVGSGLNLFANYHLSIKDYWTIEFFNGCCSMTDNANANKITTLLLVCRV